MKKLNLCGTWEMTGDDGRSFPSEVPGSVLKTLLDCEAIPDPFDETNEFSVCAETLRRWSFARSFRVTEEELAHANADLVFEGLDTLAVVELNGQTAARWCLTVKPLTCMPRRRRKSPGCGKRRPSYSRTTTCS